jgi:hypothetical protein
MCFNISDHHVHVCGELASRGLEHGVSFANARAHAEEHFEAAAFFPGCRALNGSQQRVGIRALTFVHRIILTILTLNSA